MENFELLSELYKIEFSQTEIEHQIRELSKMLDYLDSQLTEIEATLDVLLKNT